MTDHKQNNKKGFLKYSDKQREAVKSYTNYWIFGVVIAAAVLIILLLTGSLEIGAIQYPVIIAIVLIAVWYFLSAGKHLDRMSNNYKDDK